MCDLSFLLKSSRVLQSFTDSGSLFHSRGAADLNALSPHDLLILGTRRVEALDERRPERDGLWKFSKDEMYCGDENFKARNVMRRTL